MLPLEFAIGRNVDGCFRRSGGTQMLGGVLQRLWPLYKPGDHAVLVFLSALREDLHDLLSAMLVGQIMRMNAMAVFGSGVGVT